MDEETINYQIGFSFLSIIAAIVSIVLLINNKYKLIYDEGFLNDKTSYKINLYNRILLVIVFSIFLLINYNNYKKAMEKGEDPTSYKLQVYSSILIVIATLISLYVVYNYQGSDTLENPEI
ncbi:MAG: hypothetical protein IJ565_03510 [Bacilli bacterium]|nr:hypothetical protein [Bacilli bacterium]